MELSANYIKRIEIDGLWDRFNIVWDLRPDVNILSGINGVGKTTILNRSSPTTWHAYPTPDRIPPKTSTGR